GQTGAIRRARLAALGAGRVFGKDRLDQRPQFVGHQQLAHRVLRDGDALNCAHGRGIWELVFLEALSVLDHLGRHLYRSFATVLGEAISNAWDADARNVWIYLDADQNGFWIKDDGIGMTADDFQKKFLKIGYSKRKGGKHVSKKGRPFIGRKGIG